MNGFQAEHKRNFHGEKAGKQRGGLIRGPGSGTSDDIPMEVPVGGYILPADSTRALGLGFGQGNMPQGALSEPGLGFSSKASVPAQVSNGEYAISPGQVNALGMQILDMVKNVTHAPAQETRKQEPFFKNGGACGFRRRFADGGGTDDDDWPTSGRNSWNDPNLPENRQRQAFDSAIDKVGEAGRKYIGTPTEYDDNNDPISGPAASPSSAAAPAPRNVPTASTADAPSPGQPAATPAPSANRGLLDMGLDQKMIQQAKEKGQSNFYGRRDATDYGTPSNPLPDGWGVITAAPGAAGFRPSTLVAPETYRDMAGKPTQDWQKTPQYAAAVERNARLAEIAKASGNPSLPGVTPGAQPATESGPRVMEFGNVDDAAKDRMLQEYQSLMTNPTFSDLKDPQRYATRLDAFGQALGLDDKAAADRAGNRTMLERERMQQEGANRRAADANALARESATNANALVREDRGFRNRTERRLESLYQQYEAAKTPEERSAIVERIDVLRGGRSNEGEWKAIEIGGGEDEMGNKLSGSVAMYNTKTGEIRQQPPNPGASPYEKGRVYTDANGNKAMWNGTKFVPV